MSGSDDSGDKTEQPTPKKLQDARKKGQVSKSKDIITTLELVVWFVLASMAVGWAANQLLLLFDFFFEAIGQPFALAAPALAMRALHTLLALTAATLLPVCAVGVLIEYVQVGPMFAVEKLTPKFENLNPVAGIKRMFSLDNLIEVGKSIVKTLALLLVGYIVVKGLLPAIVKLAWGQRPQAVGAALWAVAKPLLAWTVGLFAMLSVLDLLYQRWSFIKKMRMSHRDIKQEHKENDGDPYIKAHRRQLAADWAQQGAAQSARRASALVVNPTHVAVAIEYDREACPVPTVSAKGEEEVARAMREAAEEAGVPIVRNVALARDLLGRVEEGDVVPADLFDVVAELILWAQEVREDIERSSTAEAAGGPGAMAQHGADEAPAPSSAPPGAGPNKRRRAPPGEDLTRYPDPARQAQAGGGFNQSGVAPAVNWPPVNPA